MPYYFFRIILILQIEVESKKMPYISNRVVHDADSHTMELPNWYKEFGTKKRVLPKKKNSRFFEILFATFAEKRKYQFRWKKRAKVDFRSKKNVQLDFQYNIRSLTAKRWVGGVVLTENCR